MRRFAVSLAALTLACTGLALAAGDRPAWACSCAESTLAEHAARADVVFTGTLTEVIRPESVGENVTLEFDVATVYQGTAAPVQAVVTSDDSCGLGYAQPGDWLVFAAADPGGIDDWQPGTLYAGYCSGWVPWDGASEPAGLAGPGRPPTPEPAPTSTESPETAPVAGPEAALVTRPPTSVPAGEPADDGWSTNDWLRAAVVAVPVLAMLGFGVALFVRRR